MSDHERRPSHVNVTPIVPPATAGGNRALSFVVGALLVVVLVVGYFAISLPVLRTPNEAHVPDRQIDVTIQQPVPATLGPGTAPAPSAQPLQ